MSTTMLNFKIITLIVTCILMVACSSTSKMIGESKDELVTQLKYERSNLGKLISKIERAIKDKNESAVPYKILVKEAEASKFKERIKFIYQSEPQEKENLKPLVNIIESCEYRENNDVTWDEYCFSEVPWFGVEPILNAWMNDITLAIDNLK